MTCENTCKTCAHFSREPSDEDGWAPWYSLCQKISLDDDDVFPQDGSGFCWMYKARSIGEVVE